MLTILIIGLVITIIGLFAILYIQDKIIESKDEITTIQNKIISLYKEETKTREELVDNCEKQIKILEDQNWVIQEELRNLYEDKFPGHLSYLIQKYEQQNSKEDKKTI